MELGSEQARLPGTGALRLDPEQRAAVEAGGTVLVLAGPGSGKTRVLVERVALQLERGLPPEACPCIAFGRRAAEELRERLERRLPGLGGRVPVHTFHGLALELLRERPGAAGLEPGFRVLDQGDLAAELARREGLSEGRALSRLRREPGLGRELLAGRRDAVALDELVERAARALEAEPAWAAELRARHRHLAVDEVQDLDAGQLRLLELLAPRELFAIGDPDQSIYGFRGAEPEAVLAFFEERGAAVHRLATNYRSSPEIVRVAGALLGGRDHRAARPAAGEVRWVEAPSERAEAEFVVHTLEQLLGGHSFFSLDSGRTGGEEPLEGLSFGEVAVLYRTEALARELEVALERSGMPYQRRSHRALAERPELRELLAALEAEPPPAEHLEAWLEERIGEGDPLLPGLRALARRAGGAAELAEALRLGSEVDAWDPRADRISLLTLHAAKGLEFRLVFIVGVEDGLLPLRFGRSVEPDEVGEERRLLYVGVTRAKERLYLSRALRRQRRGEARETAVSPFLAPLLGEPGLPLRRLERSWGRRAAGAEEDRQLSLF